MDWAGDLRVGAVRSIGVLVVRQTLGLKKIRDESTPELPNLTAFEDYNWYKYRKLFVTAKKWPLLDRTRPMVKQ